MYLRIILAFEYGFDPTDEKQRRMAAAYLLEKVSWTDISSDFKISLTSSRTQQLCDAMTVSKDMMANLLLAAGGRGGIVQVGEVLPVSLLTGTVRKRILAGEFKVKLYFHMPLEVISKTETPSGPH